MPTDDNTQERWQMLASYSIGKITPGEYADFLESQPDYDPDDPIERIIIDRLREDAETPGA